ncbi:MAG: peptidoglycan DD-metalloendopeptidase family protein [Candidatus Omnitrophota bacterium]
MKKIFIAIILTFFAAGCATTTTPPQTISTIPLPKPHSSGVYHQVIQGQTLWGIAKAYRVDIQDIIDSNRMSDPSKIDKGQMIFIPGTKDVIEGDLSAHLPKETEKNYIWPLKGRVISYFNSKRDNVANKGIDIEAKEGQIVVASRSGKVVFCDEKVKGLGKALIVEHSDGYSTLYAHNSENLVTCGDSVTQNQPIAKAGSSGRANRPTLHFQVRKGHKPHNPFYYLP